jgi:hypothetical protein
VTPPSSPPVVQIIQPAAKTEQVVITLSFSFSARGNNTTLTALQARNVPAGATVIAKCKGKSCPKSKKKVVSFTKRNAFDRVTLKPWVKKRLRTGTTLTVTVTKPGMNGQVKKLVIQKGKAPRVTTSCIADKTNKAIPCPT